MMTDSPMSAGPPPGWYADSPQAARLRWWNGTAWTDHYQAATDATAVPVPVRVPVDAIETPPATTPAPQAPPAQAPHSQAPAAHTPSAKSAWLPASEPEAFPDQILGRAPRMGEYQPPPRPVVYQPHAVNYAAKAPPTLVPVSSKNGPATSSLVLSAVGVAAGVAVYAWVSPTRPTLGGLLNLLIMAAFLCAVGLAVVGLVLAAQRPTRKGRSVFALAVSVLLLGGMLTLLAVRMIPVGALSGAG